MIDGVTIAKLKVIPDERGRLMEMMRSDESDFIKFGQVYMTTAYPGAVKGWHYHKEQHDNMVVVSGMMKIVLYDMRAESPTRGEIRRDLRGSAQSGANPYSARRLPWLQVHLGRGSGRHQHADGALSL